MGRIFPNNQTRYQSSQPKVTTETLYSDIYQQFRMITDQIVQRVVKDVSQKLNLHKWKGMRRLNLKLNKYYQIYHSDVTELLIRCEAITDKTLRAITGHLKPHISGLQKLNFDFTQCHSITAGGLKNFTTEITRYLPRLRQLHFNYPEYSLSLTKNSILYQL